MSPWTHYGKYVANLVNFHVASSFVVPPPTVLKASALSPLAAMTAQSLESMSVRELRLLASEKGIADDDIEAAMDSDDPKEALLKILLNAKATMDFDGLSVRDLSIMAENHNIAKEDIDEARDGCTPEASLIAVL